MAEHDLQDYLFDLNGFLVLENVINPAHLAALNAAFDAFPQDLGFREWWGDIQRLDNNDRAGMELQNIVHAGKAFEDLIDHPAWIDKMRRYCGEDQTWIQGLFIDECFASIRRTGGFFPMHSGGHERAIRNQYGYADGRWQCGQVNILVALTDINKGDGGTRVIPGSHKSNIAHPVFRQSYADRCKLEDETVEGAIEVTLKAGSALLFSDAISHGATRRTNPGERRVVIYRYGPGWGNTRYGYRYSQALLDRVTPAQRAILQPVEPRLPGMSKGLERGAE